MNPHLRPTPWTRTPPSGVRAVARGPSARVLVVHGEESVAAAIGGTLLADGHDVTVVLHALDAVSLLKSGETYDVILCAIDMPGGERALLEQMARPCYVQPAELSALRDLVQKRATMAPS